MEVLLVLVVLILLAFRVRPAVAIVRTLARAPRRARAPKPAA